MVISEDLDRQIPVMEFELMADKDSLLEAAAVLTALQPGKGMGAPRLEKR